MAFRAGETFKLGRGIRTGVAPGQSQYGVGAGQQVKILGSRNVGGQLYYDIQHIGGGTGWVPASSLQGSAGGGGGATPYGKFTSKASSLIATQQKQAAAQRKAYDAEQRRLRQQLEARQKAEEQGFLGRFGETIGGFDPLSVLRERFAGELGLPGAREAQTGLFGNIMGLQGRISGLPEMLQAETAGTGITQAQMAKLQAARGDPLSRQLVDLSRTGAIQGEQLGRLEQELGTRLSDELAAQSQTLKPFELEAGFLSDRLAREVSGFNQDRQNQLDLMLNEIQTGAALTDQQVTLLANLAMQEQKFLDQKAMLQFQQQFKTGGGVGDQQFTNIPQTTGGTTSPAPKSKPGVSTTGAFNLGPSKTKSGFQNINLGGLGFSGGFSLGSGLGQGGGI